MPAMKRLKHRTTRRRLLTVVAQAKGTLVGRVYDVIDNATRQWLTKQPMFFVATAPNDPDAHVNLSPKGAAGAFRVLGPTTVAYVDLVGSGVETAAHLRENGRIVLMFCAFAGPPKIIRLHGQGRVVPDDDSEFAALLPEFSLNDDARALARGIVVVETTRISDSCGFVVPRMDLVAERDQLMRWSEQQYAKNGEIWKKRYVAANNAHSIDGLPGYDPKAELAPDEAMTVSSSGRAL
jgi:predicted pyridoxine 5'-phosphate oxidase superfamily flavin-nucleotide-binding protein